MKYRLLWSTTYILLQLGSFLLCPFAGIAQQYKFIKNFPPNIYKASPAIYNITSDELGVMYFATNNGVVVFDGARWKTITISNFSEVRTLERGPDGLIYVGANGNFGFLNDDIDGVHYVSLSDSLSPENSNFNEVWQIVFYNDKVYFQTYAGIYIWDHGKLDFEEIDDVFIFNIHNTLYGSRYGTSEFGPYNAGVLTPFERVPDMKEDMVFATFDLEATTALIATGSHGLFRFDEASGDLQTFHSEINPSLMKFEFYDGIRLQKDLYVLGTWTGGIFFMDQSGKVIQQVNQKNGLYANYIYDIYATNNNSLWLATSYGITKISLDSLCLNLIPHPYTPGIPEVRQVEFELSNVNHSLYLPSDHASTVVGLFENSGSQLKLFHLPGRLAFYFANTAQAGEELHYAVKLEGYDLNWTEWKPETLKEYTNLKEGKYTFLIQSRKDANQELSAITSYTVQIYAPWYYTAWLKIIAILMIILGAYYIVRLMILRLKTQNMRLEAIVNERTQDLLEKQQHLKELNNNLISTNRELDSFVYHTSHDLKAPLKSILGLVNLAKIEDSRKLFSEYHDRIESSVHKLEEFISSIIQYSLNTQSNVVIKPVNFHEVVESSLSALQYHEEYSNITIIKSINSQGDFYSDEKRIQIIMNNLLSNAIKYHDNTKEQQVISIEINQQTGSAEICIQDNGLGIRDDLQEKVFTMFFRASEKSYGSGLGLYIIKETVKKLGGSIYMESMEGLFTKFVIRLPNFEIQIENAQQ